MVLGFQNLETINPRTHTHTHTHTLKRFRAQVPVPEAWGAGASPADNSRSASVADLSVPLHVPGDDAALLSRYTAFSTPI
jgi:hypothetical protein